MKAPTRRALAKQQTRAKVPGRRSPPSFFSEQGYEGATIRDIAAAAGMSTGAVFANFSDKSDLFREIMITDMAALADAMREAGGRGSNAEDSLLKIFMAGYAFYKTQLPLARAAFSVGWSPEDGPALRRAPPVNALNELMAESLNRGVRVGGEPPRARKPTSSSAHPDAVRNLPLQLPAGDLRRSSVARSVGRPGRATRSASSWRARGGARASAPPDKGWAPSSDADPC